MLDVKDLVEQYIDFLKTNITYKQVEKGFEITTPFLDEKNDWIQIYISEVNNNEIVLSDAGECLAYWEELGITINKARREQIISSLRPFGVNLNLNNEICTQCTIKDFAKKKHSLLQAIIKVYDMSSMIQTRNIVDFSKDVADYFNKNQIYYMEGISILGKTGFVHTYDFSIQRDRNFNERFCKAINKLTKTNVISTIFGWQETKEQRKGNSDLIVFTNEQTKDIDTLTNGFNEYNIVTIPKKDFGSETCNKYFIA